MRTILPDAGSVRHTAPARAGARHFARRVAELTGTTTAMWLAPMSEGHAAELARLEAAADAILATNPAVGDADRFEEITDQTQRLAAIAEAVVAEEMLAEMTAEAERVTRTAAAARAERLAAEHAHLTAEFGTVDPEWSRTECKAITAWSPFRAGPRYITRSGRHGDGTKAGA